MNKILLFSAKLSLVQINNFLTFNQLFNRLYLGNLNLTISLNYIILQVNFQVLKSISNKTNFFQISCHWNEPKSICKQNANWLTPKRLAVGILAKFLESLAALDESKINGVDEIYGKDKMEGVRA